GANAVATRDVTGDGLTDLLVTNGDNGTLSVLPGIGNGGTATGFFNDSNVNPTPIAPLPTRQTDLLSNTQGLTLGQDGRLFGFAVAGGSSPVFQPAAGREINAFAVAGGMVFTANRDGSISALVESGEGYRELARVAELGLVSPTALEVLGRGD